MITMSAWRMPLVVSVLLCVGQAAPAQSCDLSEKVQAGDSFHLTLDMKLAGEMRFLADNGKTATLKLTAAAGHAFDERVLVAEDGQVKKTARRYETAKVNVERGKDRSENALRASRKLVVAQRHKGVHLVYSPAGALTRPELEVVGEHFDVLAVHELLPGKAVEVGSTWKVVGGAAQALTGMEGMTAHELTGKLAKLAGDEATLTFTGTASGVWQGSQVKTTVEATGTYDVKAKRLTKLTWKQKDDRDQGPVSPASSLEMTITMTRKGIERPASLDDVALVSVPEGFAPPGPMTNLEYRDPKGRYALVHPRDWHLTTVTAEHAVLRLMDGGTWVAQVTVTPWTSAKKGEHLSAEQFVHEMRNSVGWRPERELQSGEVPSEGGRWTYRLSEIGQLNGVTVLQNFYLVAAPGGEQVVLTFTLAPKMADKLGARDLTVAASIEVPAK
jgi:hypothetical protein